MQAVVNFTLKSALTILKRTMLNANLLNLIQSSLIKKLLHLNQFILLCQNLKTSTTESTENQNHFMKIFLILSKTAKSHQIKILNKELKDLSMNLDGKKMIQPKSGASDLKTLDLMLLLMSLREFNTWTKSKNQWFHPSNGHQDRVFFVMKICEEWDSTSLIANYTLILFTEVEVKLCQLLEDFIML